MVGTLAASSVAPTEAPFDAVGQPPLRFSPVDLDPNTTPQLVVVVDTEEEFDWSAPFSRESTSVEAIDDVDRLQAVLAPYRIVPTYVIDYPVAATRSSADKLGSLAHRGECAIGAHLHPWVNPPYSEPLCGRTSYSCNLGIELEGEKLSRLKDAIHEHLGVDARCYKAGRYGFGASSAALLERFDFDVDLSVNPHMNFSADGGPSFEQLDARPALFGARRRLLEIPCTTGFIGAARRLGSALHRAASTRWLERFRAVGVLAHTGALNKVMLSPEGNTYAEMEALTTALHGDGVRTFALTLHSPSLRPGCTPYARTRTERDGLLATIDRYCGFFTGRFGGVPATPRSLYESLCRTSTL